ISVATIPVLEKEAPEFGILKSGEGYIKSFIEKPDKSLLPDWVSDTGEEMKKQGRNYLASMGIYIFNTKLLLELLRNECKEATDFGKEIIPYSIHKYKVASYQYDGYWTDIGNIYSFFEANLDLTKAFPSFNLFDEDQSIFTRPRMLPPAKISGTTLEQSIIAEGCIIHAAKIERCVIGIRSRIGKGSTLKNVYVMGNDYYESINDIEQMATQGLPLMGVGDNCKIENAILDKNVRIGDNVKITGGNHLSDTDHALYGVKDGIVVVKKHAVIPDGFEI
ncbi:MAG TPA: sugar phosphate nucleotidyltransferase, partial [Chitinophagaceae bacterium]|nr:sugar phosphate nucleotidyltransferase [Chitinophagaceae bacterium]